jgi:hypothetical protein
MQENKKFGFLLNRNPKDEWQREALPLIFGVLCPKGWAAK